jgi:hypothetical protein
MDELAIQREGYARAIVSKDFLQALRAGPGSKVTYFEWSMSGGEKIIIPWRVIDGPGSADAVAAQIMKTPIRRGSSISISSAIDFAVQLFEQNPYRGLRTSSIFPAMGRTTTSSRNRRARRCSGEGHHHQRPAYHGEGAILFNDRYRES